MDVEVKLENLTPPDLILAGDSRYNNSFAFGCLDATPIIEIRHDTGDIFVKGKLIENDIELVEAFKTFFKQQGLYGKY
jgi:hypothetical protein